MKINYNPSGICTINNYSSVVHYIVDINFKPETMKTSKEIFDAKYEYYRNMLRKPAIPLEARQLIFDCMEEYTIQQHTLEGQRLFVECDVEFDDEGNVITDGVYPLFLYKKGTIWLKPYTPQQWIVTKEYILDIIITKISSLYTSSGRIFNEELTQKEIFDMYDRLAIRIKELLTNKEKQI